MEVLAHHIVKAYTAGTPVLNDLSLELHPGQTLGLLGNNGAGKSTLLHLLAGLLKPEFASAAGKLCIGEMQYDGSKDEAAIRARTGLLPEAGLLNPEFSGREQIQFSALLYGLDPKDETLLHRQHVLLEHLFGDETSVDAVLSKPCGSYSTGMKKKLGLVLALQHSPSLILLDEPFSGLDPGSARRVVELLNHLKGPDCCMLISSHNLSYIEQIANQIAILDKGRFAYSGSLETLTQQGREQLEASLLRLVETDDSPKNRLSEL